MRYPLVVATAAHIKHCNGATDLVAHCRYTGAPDALRIKQATMTMVPFPVEFPMPRNVQQNDLVYESSHIGTEGPAMTHSMLAIDWLQMGNKTAGDAEFVAAYNTNLVGSFMQWMECPIPPDNCQGHRPATNFLTAAGGFMQAMLYGYMGLRFNDANLTLLAPTLPLNASAISVQGLSYRDVDLSVTWDADHTRVTCERHCQSLGLCAQSMVPSPEAPPQRLAQGKPARFRAHVGVVVSPCTQSPESPP